MSPNNKFDPYYDIPLYIIAFIVVMALLLGATIVFGTLSIVFAITLNGILRYVVTISMGLLTLGSIICGIIFLVISFGLLMSFIYNEIQDRDKMKVKDLPES